ncbi:heme-degrading monooxygenase HmoA [Spinactinospora alkalitolerans]|uniref:Heme-degrading monooxygenase HmoA n=1 Tax=Spinactinospora alkalitolerans TaxID=687207 RepID=A0A852TTG1_9ACTN|nr:antibiotic biosynthesis monooxygenase family protein [Spinactinospora alkalitolerans]NYE45404.1 heme-degrading monooxygenase HmoA [Spinactinospora alkalitolerans]
MSADVFRVMLRMEIHAGKREEFERTWLAIGDSVTSHPANLGQWLSRDAEDPGVYYIVSDWESEARFREFETSERHLRHREKLHPYRSAGAMTVMHVVSHLPGTGAARTHEEWEAVR